MRFEKGGNKQSRSDSAHQPQISTIWFHCQKELNSSIYVI
ncbi:hypothetical protein SynMITS9220_00296 [Synechococcus sp. MIT S9220]|nr:hypothetical protein SynMITS9220_00296 [Synechococcus sp. MIT S9220]